MKKNLFMLAAAAIVLIGFNSCKDVLDLDKELKFSKLSVEEQKASIEQSGIDFVDNMDDMMNSKAMGALSFYVSYNSENLSLVKPFTQLQSDLVNRNTKVLENLDKQLKVVAQTNEDNWGTYTWNDYYEAFDFKAGNENSIIYLFPTENSNSNNAELKMVFKNSSVVMPDSDPVEYMPSSINVTLKVDGSIAMKGEFTSSYKSDATPTKAKQTLEIGDYSWTAEMSNNTEKVSASYVFKNGSKTLVKMEAGVEGNLTTDAIEESDNPQDVISNGAVYFQLMNVACLGGVSDLDGLMTELSGLSASSEYALAVKEAEVVNKYVKLYGYFVDENKKFADVEFYAAEVEDENYNTSYEVQPRFVLSDGSKVDAQDYIETGFEDLFNKLAELAELEV